MENKSTNENLISIDSLMSVICESNTNFKKFIDENFHPKKLKDLQKIGENIEILKSMNEHQQIIVKARAKEFEEDCDLSKYITPMIALFGFMVAAYRVFSEFIIYKNLAILFNVVLAFGLGYVLMRVYQTLTIQRSSAVFFNNLISNINFDEK